MPPQAIVQRDNNVPKIGGSEGGFIGLVVALGVIIVGSCIGVFFLLRNRPHGGRTTRTKSGEVGVEPAFPKRRGTLFGFRSKNPRKGGWIQASGNGDDEVDAEFVGQRQQLGSREVQTGALPLTPGSYGHGAVLREEEKPDAGAPRSSASLSSVQLAAPGSHEVGMGHSYVYADPFSISSATSATASPPRFASPDIHEGANTRSYQHPRSASPDEHEGASVRSYSHSPPSVEDGPQKQLSGDSSRTATSFPGGTRFMEVL